jgi:hypothetical protein
LGRKSSSSIVPVVRPKESVEKLNDRPLNDRPPIVPACPGKGRNAQYRALPDGSMNRQIRPIPTVQVRSDDGPESAKDRSFMQMRTTSARLRAVRSDLVDPSNALHQRPRRRAHERTRS